MRRSLLAMAARPGRRGGLALPTALAAVVCGGSVLAIAVSGTIALDGDRPVAIEVGALAGPETSVDRPTVTGAPGTHSSVLPPVPPVPPVTSPSSVPSPAAPSAGAAGLAPEETPRPSVDRGVTATAGTATDFSLDAGAVAAPAVSVVEPPLPGVGTPVGTASIVEPAVPSAGTPVVGDPAPAAVTVPPAPSTPPEPAAPTAAPSGQATPPQVTPPQVTPPQVTPPQATARHGMVASVVTRTLAAEVPVRGVTKVSTKASKVTKRSTSRAHQHACRR